MRKFGYIAASAIAALLAGPAMAGGLPASQAAIAYDDLSVVDTVGKWTRWIHISSATPELM